MRRVDLPDLASGLGVVKGEVGGGGPVFDCCLAAPVLSTLPQHQHTRCTTRRHAKAGTGKLDELRVRLQVVRDLLQGSGLLGGRLRGHKKRSQQSAGNRKRTQKTYWRYFD